MSKAYIINKEDQEIVINLQQIDKLYNNSISITGLELPIASELDIDAIFEATEECEKGGDTQAAYTEGYNAGIPVGKTQKETEIVNNQKSSATNYYNKLGSVDETIGSADKNTIGGQNVIFSQSYNYVKTPSEIENIQETAYENGESVGYTTGYAAGYYDATHPEPYKGLCFTSKQSKSYVGLWCGQNDTVAPINPKYSYDGITWYNYNLQYTESSAIMIPLMNVGDKVYFKADSCNSENFDYANFVMTGKIEASGSIMSLTGDENSTDMTGNNFRYLFRNCKSLTTAPELPATTLADSCYYQMFYGCTALTTAPELPATTLANYCYQGMFYNCTSLTTAPELPATTLADSCYYQMFYGCTALTTAPELPATTLAETCYYQMFYGCTSLTTAPELPATTLAINCYHSMFSGCTSLTTAPELPATTLATNCYQYMFYNCSNLNYIKVGATSWSTSNAGSWVKNVASTGTFIKPDDTEIPTGVSGIPSGWTVNPVAFKGLCFTAEQAGSTIKQNYGKSGCTYQTSTDGTNWTNYTLGTTITLANVGDKVYWKGDGLYQIASNKIFIMTGKIGASGSVMSLIDGEGTSTTIPSGNNFRYLFNGCTSLTTAPELPATTLAQYAYSCMFEDCTSLTTAPELPATNVDYLRCYQGMFSGCTSLTSAPELYGNKVRNSCYTYMFYNCSNLNYIKIHATQFNTSEAENWVDGVSSTGTFIKPSSTSIPTGTSGIPSGWTVENV